MKQITILILAISISATIGVTHAKDAVEEWIPVIDIDLKGATIVTDPIAPDPCTCSGHVPWGGFAFPLYHCYCGQLECAVMYSGGGGNSMYCYPRKD